MQTVMQMKTVKQMLQSYSTIHTATKRLLIFCSIYVAVIMLCSIVLLMLAGRGIDYYAATQWAADLFSTVRPCVGVAALGGLLIEGSLHNAC